MIPILLLSKLNTGIKQTGILKAICFLVLNLGLLFSLQAQTFYVDGNPPSAPSTPTSISIARFPLSNNYPFERSAALYLGNEINASGNITQIGFYLLSTNSPATVPVKIYFKQTSATALTSSTFSNELALNSPSVLVFEGNVTVPNIGNNPAPTPVWFDIQLDNSFNYSSANNLEVLIETNCTSCTGGNGLEQNFDAKQFRFNETTTSQFEYWENTSQTNANNSNGTLYNQRPSIRLAIQQSTPTCTAPITLTSTVTGQTTTTVNFSGGSTGAGIATVEYGPTSTFNNTPTTNQTVPVPANATSANLTGLSPDTEYTFRVRIACANGINSANSSNATFKTDAPPVTACNAPTASNTTNITTNSATVNFSGGSTGTSYQITYTPTSSQIQPVTTTGSSFSLTGLAPGTQYTYQIRTNCNGTLSANSLSNTFTTQPATTPTCDPPTAASVATTGPGTDPNTAQVIYTPSSTGTAGTYFITYTRTAPTTGSPVLTQLTSTSFTLSGLDAGATYSYSVFKDCDGTANGTGTISSNNPGGSFQTQTATPTPTCATPTDLAVTKTSTTAQLTFTDNTTTEPGTFTVKYGAPGFNFGTAGTPVSGPPYNVSGLTAGTNYEFAVQKNCTNGTSGLIEREPFTTDAATSTCAAPTTSNTTNITSNSATVNFTGGSTGANVTYELTYTPNGTGTQPLSTTGNTFSITGLAPGTTYTYSIRTNCNGTFSSAISGTFTTNCPQAIVSNVAAGPGSLTFTYTSSPGTNTITLTSASAPTVTTTLGASPATIGGLRPNTIYDYSIVTDCGDLNSPATTGTAPGTQPLSTTCVAGTWLGTTSSDWHNAANWCNATIPDVNTDVLIPVSTTATPVPNYPVITLDAFTRNLTIETGATLTFSPAIPTIINPIPKLLTISGSFLNRGTFTANGNGSLAFTSPSLTPQLLGKPGQVLTFLDLTTGVGGILQGGPIEIKRVLTLNGDFITGGNSLTLLADNANQSMVVNNGAAEVIGNATMEKYINPGVSPSFRYRHVSAPISNATLNDLNDDVSLTLNPAYINNDPTTANPFPNIFRYNELRLNTVATPTFDTGWESPGSLNEPMVPGEGFSVNMMAVTYDFTGDLNNGPITRTLRKANASTPGWNLIGNPYPSPIDWNLVNKGNVVDAAAYIFTPSPSDQYGGSYRSYVNGIPAGGQYIAATQGFFVRANANGAAINFENNDRVTTYVNPAIYKQAETRPIIALTLTNSSGTQDQTYVYFENGATPNFDSNFDAFKLPNAGSSPSIYSIAGADLLSINGLPVSTTTTVIPLGGYVPQAGTWTILADQIINFWPNQVIYLEDMVTNTLHNLKQQSSYTFNTTQTGLTGRFNLRFGPGATTGITPAEMAKQVLVYPNPNKGQFTLSMPAFNSPMVEAALFNAIGQKVWQKTLQTNGAYLKETITTHKLPHGVYTLRLETSAGPVQRKLIIE